MKSQSTIGRKKFILHHYIYDLKAEQSTTRHLQFISILLAVLLLTVVVVPYYMDIRPVRAAPTEITNIDGLYAIRNTLDGDYVLMNDLDFNDNDSYTGTGEQKNTKRLDNTTDDGWLPIASSSTAGLEFTGTFDGQNYTISNLFISRSLSTYIGLFGYADDATISNIGLLDVDVTDSDGRAGVVIGLARNNVTVDNCYTTGTITTGSNGRTGGLVGLGTACTINNSYSSVNVTSTGPYVGGLIGEAKYINFSYATGTIKGQASVGGLCGKLGPNGIINECYATGLVNGTQSSSTFVGGLVGHNDEGIIKNSYANGSVIRGHMDATTSSFGGFVGHNDQGNITNCYSTGLVSHVNGSQPTTKGFAGAATTGGSYYDNGNFWDTQTSSQSSSSGSATGKTTAEMKTLATFSSAGWDIIAVGSHDGETWYIDAGNDYPRLGWEYEEPVIETSFTLAGLTDTNITWYGLRGESVWCNDTGTGSETLQIQMTCNLSVNVTHIDIYLNDLSYSGNTLSAENVTLYVSSNNNNFGSLGAFADGGGNISINTSTWNAGTMGSDPFPIGPSESFTIYARFLLAIPSGDSPPDGTYVSTGFKVYTSGYS